MRKSKRIFRPKRRYRIKKRNDNAIKIISGVAALAVLVFVGYSAADILPTAPFRLRQSHGLPKTPTLRRLRKLLLLKAGLPTTVLAISPAKTLPKAPHSLPKLPLPKAQLPQR